MVTITAVWKQIGFTWSRTCIVRIAPDVIRIRAVWKQSDDWIHLVANLTECSRFAAPFLINLSIKIKRWGRSLNQIKPSIPFLSLIFTTISPWTPSTTWSLVSQLIKCSLGEMVCFWVPVQLRYAGSGRTKGWHFLTTKSLVRFSWRICPPNHYQEDINGEDKNKYE